MASSVQPVQRRRSAGATPQRPASNPDDAARQNGRDWEYYQELFRPWNAAAA
jgi:hypothetical protein